MITRFRAWLKEDKEMVDVEEINFYNGEFDFIRADRPRHTNPVNK